MQNKRQKIHFDLSDRTNMFYWQTNRRVTAKQQKAIFLERHYRVNKEDAIAAIEFGMQKSGISKGKAGVVKISEPIKYGSVNSVFRASLKGGIEVVIRMHPYFVKNGYFWVESVATKKAKEFGVPVYQTYFIDDSFRRFNFDYMIMEALPGKTMQEIWPIEKRLDGKLIRETGKFAALIHKVKPEGFGFFRNEVAKKEGKLVGQYKKFSEHIYAGMEEDLGFLIKHKVFTKTQRKKIEKIFEKNEGLLECKTPSLVHNDIADWNELTDGKRITGIVDWDECFAGDPVMDFAQWSLFFDEKRLKHFVGGYQEVSNLPEGYKEKLHLFKLRYLISKMHLRKKRLLVIDSQFVKKQLERAMQVMKEEFAYFVV